MFDNFVVKINAYYEQAKLYLGKVMLQGWKGITIAREGCANYNQVLSGTREMFLDLSIAYMLSYILDLQLQ